MTRAMRRSHVVFVPSKLLGLIGVVLASIVACDGSVDGAPIDAGSDAASMHDTAVPVDSGEDLDAGEDAAMPPPPATRVCTQDDWCWQLPHPQGHGLLGVWASARDDIWAVGVDGLIIHYDGNGWSRANVGVETDLNAIFGIARDDIWAVGELGVVLHYDGARWTSMPTEPETDAAVAAPRNLYAVWGKRADEVWIAGDRGRLYRYDGRVFNIVSGLPEGNLRALWGATADDVWAAGATGTLLHYDGISWTNATSINPTTTHLRAIHGLAVDDVWIVGDNNAIHWDGAAWTRLHSGIDLARGVVVVRPWMDAVGDAGVADAAIDAATADAGNDAAVEPAPQPVIAWAFGDRGKVWTFSGGTWAPIQSNLTQGFSGAFSLGDDDMIAIGAGGVVQRWVSGARQNISAGSNAARLTTFVDHDNAVWVAGDEIVVQRDGAWALRTPPTDRALYGIWGDATSLWAVGTAGVVVRLQNEQWTDATPDASGSHWLRAIHGAGDALWIVGNDGLALSYADEQWSAVETGTTNGLRDVWGVAADDFWAVGDDATALHWNGSAWQPVETGIDAASLRAVWGTASDDVWAVGSLGTVLHWDGDQWSIVMTGGTYSLDDIVGRDGQLWAVGNNGTLLHFSDDSWTAEQSGTSHNLHSIAIDADGVLWVAGDQGTVLSKRP